MGEFDFIATYLAPLAGPPGLGLLDDAAIFSPPAGRDLVITKDAMAEGVHFPMGHWGADTAEKLLRVNLSDLAAKGALPLGYFLSLSLPKAFDGRWGKGFALGLKTLQDEFDFTVWGGDTTRAPGPMVISATVIGSVPSGTAVRRAGAKPGDALLVTGTIGDATLGLDIVLGQETGRKVSAATGEAIWHWEQAYYRPQPRIALRRLLRAHASAALDVSDGLIADAGHLAKASDVALEIDVDAVPLSTSTQMWLAAQDERKVGLSRLLTGGDDYEILCTVSQASVDTFISGAARLGIPVTQIGHVGHGSASADRRVRPRDSSGLVWDFEVAGYQHF